MSKNNGHKNEDQRPDPKPRKLIRLWQAYLMWDEVIEMRKRHNLRISSIQEGKSNMDVGLEQAFIDDMSLDQMIKSTKKTMILFASDTPIWEWLSGIRGLKEGGLSSQLLAQIDDIGKFDTVSKLWRFAGLAVIDGRAERNKLGEKSHKNARLRSICYLISEQFLRQQTPVYSDIYYEDKLRLRELHPEPEQTNGASPWSHNFTDGHIHRMAMRKAVKIFLQHLWVTWREIEGLPVSDPYVKAIMGHTHIIEAGS